LAETWFKHYLAKIQKEIAKIRCDNEPRIRIALLDSGIDIQHEVFVKANQEGCIACGQGFPETLLPFEDKNGHGTHCASVLIRTAPAAELYIARVVDDEGHLPSDNEYEAIVQVINFRYDAHNLGYRVGGREAGGHHFNLLGYEQQHRFY
jgi:hypothetical protein